MPRTRPAASTQPAAMARQRDLHAMLSERQRDMQTVLQRRIRHEPAHEPSGGLDEPEQAEAVIQEHIDVALTQMKGDTLQRVREALARLEAGEYGRCVECDEEIAEKRLQALPFAVRCTACEALHEQSHARERSFGGLLGFAGADDRG